MEESIKETSENIVLGYSFIFMYFRHNILLSDSAKLIELKQFYLDIVKGSSSEADFLEAIENEIEEYSEEDVPDYIIDLEAFVKLNYGNFLKEGNIKGKFSIAKESILYERLLNIGIGTFNNDESNFNLLKKIFDFDYNKEILLGTIYSIKLQDFNIEDVPKCLIDFEDYVKANNN